jgi:DNA-binding CsgD family transcriptional regulator
MTEKEKSKLRVSFTVDDDEAANKIAALLDALGFETVREFGPTPPGSRMKWAVQRLANTALLTERERDILGHVLEGHTSSEIANDMGLTRATIKWHLHNVFAKTGTVTREELLRKALELGRSSMDGDGGNEGNEDALDTIVGSGSASEHAVAEHAGKDND